jgi:hypothetical protein
MQKTKTQPESTKVESEVALEPLNEAAETILRWANERGIQRLRPDRQVGYPAEEHLVLWSRKLEQWGIAKSEDIFEVLDDALNAATRSGEWHSWTFLTLQVQLAAERLKSVLPEPAAGTSPALDLPDEDPASDWAVAKQKIRNRIGEVPFLNWFERTRQVERRGEQITIAVPDEPSRFFLQAEYGNVTRAVLANVGIERIELTIALKQSETHEPEGANK